MSCFPPFGAQRVLGRSLVPQALASVSVALDSQGMSGLVGVAWATALQGMSWWLKSYRGSGSVHISFFSFSLSFEN